MHSLRPWAHGKELHKRSLPPSAPSPFCSSKALDSMIQIQSCGRQAWALSPAASNALLPRQNCRLGFQRRKRPTEHESPSPLAASPPPKARPGLGKSPAVQNKQCEQLGPEQLLGMSAAWALAGRTAARGAGGWQGGPRSSSSLPEYSWLSRCLA